MSKIEHHKASKDELHVGIPVEDKPAIMHSWGKDGNEVVRMDAKPKSSPRGYQCHECYTVEVIGYFSDDFPIETLEAMAHSRGWRTPELDDKYNMTVTPLCPKCLAKANQP